MVNIIENRACIEGVVCSISENPALTNYLILEMKLQKSLDIENFPNLAKADEGSTIRINVRPEQLSEHQIREGVSISLKVRKAFGQIYFLQ